MFSSTKTDERQAMVGLMRFKLTRSVTLFLAKSGLICAFMANVLISPAAAASNLAPFSLSGPVISSRSDSSAQTSTEQPVAPVQLVRLANFGVEVFSPESQKLADWVVDSGDNGTLPFMIIDKMQARVFVFDAQGQLRGAAAALLGLAVGDHTVPGIGQRKLSSIRPVERTTPAGRFVASLDRDLHGDEVLWVDYDSALSLHRVVKGHPTERRAERLASPSPLDNRISFGCINVPVKFYEQVVSPSFTGTNGIVYILPETRTAREVFGSYDVQDPSRKQASAGVVPVGDSTTQRSSSTP